MKTSKVVVVTNAILGKIASIVGYFIGIMLLLVIIGNMSDMDRDGAVSTMVILLIFLGLSVLSVIKGRQIKKRIRRFKTYVRLISVEQMTSLESIANSTSQSLDFVRKDLQEMIFKKFFADALIDMKTNEIIIGNRKDTECAPAAATGQSVQAETETVRCPGCGAMSTKPKGMQADCEYCGSAMK